MQVIGFKTNKRCLKQTRPSSCCWWRKLEAEIGLHTSCVFRPLLPVSSRADSYRLKAQAEEAQRIMQAEYKSSPSSPTSLTVCTHRWSKRFILWTHKPTSILQLFGTDTSAVTTCNRFTPRFKKLMRSTIIPDILRYSMYFVVLSEVIPALFYNCK